MGAPALAHTHTVPIRTWLLVVLFLVYAVPVGVTIALELRSGSRLEGLSRQVTAREVARSAGRWADPTWQSKTRQLLADASLDVILWGPAGEELFRSSAPPAIGPSGVPDSGGDLWLMHLPVTATHSGPAVLAAPVAPPGGGSPAPVAATFWGPARPASSALLPALPRLSKLPLDELLAPLGGLTALLVTLLAIAAMVQRAFMVPLAALARAARQVAGGDLDFQVPSSKLREVAEVSAAFRAMGDGLRDSLRHAAELEQERRMFVGAIVHDLRTPLFALRGHLQGLATGVAASPEKSAHYVAVCQDKAAALERLVEELFAYVQVEYLQADPLREPLALDVILRRAADGVRPRAEAKGLTLQLHGPAEPCRVEGDAHQLTRAVENLLDNAVRYTTSGTVRLAWWCEPERAVFTVTDSGPGIAPHDLPHLFTPLYRGEASRNRRTGGAGLGLAIAQRILRAHGGDLTAANAPSGGAQFTAVLPAPA